MAFPSHAAWSLTYFLLNLLCTLVTALISPYRPSLLALHNFRNMSAVDDDICMPGDHSFSDCGNLPTAEFQPQGVDTNINICKTVCATEQLSNTVVDTPTEILLGNHGSMTIGKSIYL